MNRSHILAVFAIFSVIALVGCASHGGRSEKETPIAMSDVPPAVRATLERESAGGKVTEVEKEMKSGKVVYSADMVINGVEWDITVADDGSVISKTKE